MPVLLGRLLRGSRASWRPVGLAAASTAASAIAWYRDPTATAAKPKHAGGPGLELLVHPLLVDVVVACQEGRLPVLALLDHSVHLEAPQDDVVAAKVNATDHGLTKVLATVRVAVLDVAVVWARA